MEKEYNIKKIEKISNLVLENSENFKLRGLLTGVCKGSAISALLAAIDKLSVVMNAGVVPSKSDTTMLTVSLGVALATIAVGFSIPESAKKQIESLYSKIDKLKEYALQGTYKEFFLNRDKKFEEKLQKKSYRKNITTENTLYPIRRVFDKSDNLKKSINNDYNDYNKYALLSTLAVENVALAALAQNDIMRVISIIVASVSFLIEAISYLKPDNRENTKELVQSLKYEAKLK